MLSQRMVRVLAVVSMTAFLLAWAAPAAQADASALYEGTLGEPTLDPVHSKIYWDTSWYGDRIRVTDLSGNVIDEITGVGTPEAMALNGTTLYVSDDDSNTISVIDTATDTVTGTFSAGGSADDLVYAGGRLWFYSNDCNLNTSLRSVDPVVPGSQKTYAISIASCPDLLTSPAIPDTLFILRRNTSSAPVYRYDLTTDPPSVVATSTTGGIDGTGQLAPDGSGLLATRSSGNDEYLVELDPATLALVSSTLISPDYYWDLGVSPDGETVAVRGSNSGTTTFVRDTGATISRWNQGVSRIIFSPDGAQLVGTNGYWFTELDDPSTARQTGSILFDAIPSVYPGDTYAISGTLVAPGSSVANQSIMVARTSPGGPVVHSTTTANDGTFAVQDELTEDGYHVYYAFWSGTNATTSAWGNGYKTFDRMPSTVTMSASPDVVMQGDAVQITGMLSFQDAADASGQPIHLSLPGYREADITTVAGGQFSYVDHPPEVDEYARYGASFPGTFRYENAGWSDEIEVRDQRLVFASTRKGNWQLFSADTRGNYEDQITTKGKVNELPASSPDGDKVAFDSNRSGDLDIWTVNMNGTGAKNLTADASVDLAPSWSPDATKIAYMSKHDGVWDIWVANADGSNKRNLTRDAPADGAPVWSPDGAKIAFASAKNGDFDIWVMDADGSDRSLLVDDPEADYWPAWSPDGTRLVFLRSAGDRHDVWSVRLKGTGAWRLINAKSSLARPDFSPNGNRIAITIGRGPATEVLLMNKDGSRQRTFYDAFEDGYRDAFPAWRDPTTQPASAFLASLTQTTLTPIPGDADGSGMAFPRRVT